MNSPTLLCIDDRLQMLELRKSTLETKGYSVKLASNSYDAIKTLEETSVATVLLGYSALLSNAHPNSAAIAQNKTPQTQLES